MNDREVLGKNIKELIGNSCFLIRFLENSKKFPEKCPCTSCNINKYRFHDAVFVRYFFENLRESLKSYFSKRDL